MTSYKNIREYEAEARSRGWAWSSLENTGQPKITTWYHRDKLYVDGSVWQKAPVEVPNQANTLHNKMVMARRGQLPYPPSELCMCEWCCAKRGKTYEPVTYAQILESPKAEAPEVESPPLEVSPSPNMLRCTELNCEWQAKFGSEAQQRNALRLHLRKHIAEALRAEKAVKV